MPSAPTAASVLTEIDQTTTTRADPGPAATVLRGDGLQQPWSPELVTKLSSSFLLFGGIICAVTAVLLWRRCRAADILRAFSLPLIIVSAVYLVVTGYSDQQISSIVGLLGAIAGYILGQKEPAVRDRAGRSPSQAKLKPALVDAHSQKELPAS
jgi:hypothetical protein